MTKRSLTIALVVLAVAVVTGVVAGGWLLWSARVAGDIHVAWSPDSPVCEGTEVARAQSSRPVIDAEEGMRCVVTVEVANDSGHTVHLARAVAPVVGPRTGAVVTAENAEHGTHYGIDALFPLDQDLADGESASFEVVLVLNPQGCNAGGTLTSWNWPTVTVEVWGRSHDVQGDRDFSFHREGATPGCHD